VRVCVSFIKLKNLIFFSYKSTPMSRLETEFIYQDLVDLSNSIAISSLINVRDVELISTK
jgi:hypothetical protein